MMLRWLVANAVQQATKKKLYETLQDAAQAHLQGRADDTQGSQAPPPQLDIAILFALPVESGGLLDRLKSATTSACQSFTERIGLLQERPIVLAESGVGQQAARQATEDLIALHRPQWIVSAGFAASLSPQLPRGHILMPDTVLSPAGDELCVGFRMPAESVAKTPGLHVGRLLTVDHLVKTKLEKETLAREHQAIGCDQETHAIAQVCQQQRVKFLSVRIITDGFDERLPVEIESLLNQTTIASKLGAATAAVFNRPSSVKDLWKLKEQAIKASDRLARFLEGIIGQLEAK